MPTLLVSGAGLGDSSLFGSPRPLLQGKGAVVPGWLSDGYGFPRISPVVAGRNVAFDFTVVFNQTADSVRLDFNTTRPFAPHGWSSLGVGTAVVANKAKGAFEQGWLDEGLSPPRVGFNLPAAHVNFNFTVVFNQPASNVGLYFGTTVLTDGVSAGLQTGYGTAHLATSGLHLHPVGISPLDPWVSVLIVGSGRSINFNFVQPYTPPSGWNLRFDFSLNRPIPLVGIDSAQYGTAVVHNKAQGIVAQGIDSLAFGPQTYATHPVSGMHVDFDFVDDYTPSSGANVAFAFGESKGVHPAGWDSLAFGIPSSNAPPLMFPFGWDSLVFGSHSVKRGALRPVGFEATVWGPDTTVGSIINYTRPFGIAGLTFGDHFVAYRIRTLHPFGFNTLLLGRPSVANTRHDPLRPLGFSDEAMGQPTVRGLRQYIGVVPGPDMSDFTPAPLLQDRMKVYSSIGPTQHLLPTGFDSLVSDAHYVAFWLQYIRLPIDGPEQTKWGDNAVRFRVRYIYVPWMYATQMGRPTFGYTPSIKPYPIDEGAVGTPSLSLGNVRAMQGWDSLAVSVPLVRSMHRFIRVAPWDEKDLFGVPALTNKTQIAYVDNKQYYDYVPYMGEPDVANRNRHIEPESWTSSHFPNTHRARLTGQAALPAGIDSAQFGAHLVAYRIRHVYPDMRYFFAGYIDPYHFVHNYATRIYPAGFDSSQFGLQRAWFNAQYIAPRYIKQDAYGRPFVAPAVRYLQQYDSYWGEAFGTTWVSNHVRFIVEAPWQVPYGFGTPILYTHRNIITTFAIAYNLYGTPHVRNVTPQIYTTAGDQAAIGRAWVSHSPRTLTFPGIDSLAFGGHEILFRTRYVYPFGIMQTAVSRPTVREDYEEQHSPQHIFPRWEVADSVVSTPYIPTQPEPEGWDSATFGTTWIRVQGCITVQANPDSLVGFPSLNSTQTITEINKDGELGAQTGWSKPDTKPRTIWAQIDPPEQAVANHPGELFYPLGGKDPNADPLGSLPPWFGHATVMTPHTVALLHYHGDNELIFDYTIGDLIGTPEIDNSRRYLYATGSDMSLFGYPTLNSPQTVWVVSWMSDVYGTPVVNSTRLDHTIAPAGIDSLAFDKQRAENFNRNVYPSGFSATIFGNNLPMVYHYPRGPQDVSGTDMSIFGDGAWVSYRNRPLPVEGWESFEEGYTQGFFNDRLRVTKQPMPPTYSVGDTSRFGIPDVSSGRGAPQYIGAYMIPPPELCHPHTITGGA